MQLYFILVDDQTEIVRAFKRLIQMNITGAVVHMAHQAQQALDIANDLLAEPNRALFVLTDNDMPSQEGDIVRSGVELARALKQAFGNRVYMFLATGNEVPHDAAIDFAIQKPFHIGALMTQVDTFNSRLPS